MNMLLMAAFVVTRRVDALSSEAILGPAPPRGGPGPSSSTSVSIIRTVQSRRRC